VATPRKRKGGRGPADPLEAYKRIRKPMPPPEQVMPDKRRKVQEREMRREEREGPEDGPEA
jgi:hypothetical protein